jgi:hypothetical protein
MDCGSEAGEFGSMTYSSMDTSETPGRIATAVAVLALVSVMAVLFFPAAQGPYSAVHGPVTVFHGARAAAGLRMNVVRAGLSLFRGHYRSAVALLLWTADLKAEFRTVSCAGRNSLLRC